MWVLLPANRQAQEEVEKVPVVNETDIWAHICERLMIWLWRSSADGFIILGQQLHSSLSLQCSQSAWRRMCCSSPRTPPPPSLLLHHWLMVSLLFTIYGLLQLFEKKMKTSLRPSVSLCLYHALFMTTYQQIHAYVQSMHVCGITLCTMMASYDDLAHHRFCKGPLSLSHKILAYSTFLRFKTTQLNMFE